MADFRLVLFLEGVACQRFVFLAEGCVEVIHGHLVRAFLNFASRRSNMEAEKIFNLWIGGVGPFGRRYSSGLAS